MALHKIAAKVAARYQARRMRDLFEGAPSADEELTLRIVADFHPEYEWLEPQAPEYYARLPGEDSEHPMAKVVANPMPRPIMTNSGPIEPGSSTTTRKTYKYVKQYFAGSKVPGCGVEGHKVIWFATYNLFGCTTCDRWVEAQPAQFWGYKLAPELPSQAEWDKKDFERDPDFVG